MDMSLCAAATLTILLCIQDVSAESGTAPACDRTAMSRCTSPLRVLTDNRDLGFASSQPVLARMCPTLMEGMDCFNNFTEQCLKPQQRSYFNTLYVGTQRVISDLCTEGSYQTEYLWHAPCMRTVQRGYEVCADEYHSQMDLITPVPASGGGGGGGDGGDGGDNSSLQIRKLCCSFKSYIHCSQQAVLHDCGIGTSNFTKNFLERMAGPLVATHCSSFVHGSEACQNGAGGVRPTSTVWAASLLASWLLVRWSVA